MTITPRHWLTLALLFPLLSLAGLVAVRHMALTQGREVTLPIAGFDPRDLLAGHYLTYTIDYGVEALCRDSGPGHRDPGYPARVCLEPRRFATPGEAAPAGCGLFIAGYCQQRRFVAGVERFYVPENLARPLERVIRNQRGSLVLSVGTGGHAQVKALLIDGVPWREFVARERAAGTLREESPASRHVIP